MELLSFGLYLFSLVFLLFPFLLSCLSCDSFCWLPFRLRFFLLVPFVFPILFFFLLHLHFVKFLLFLLWFLSACKLYSSCFFSFSSGGFVFPSGFACWNEAKTKTQTKAKLTTNNLAWTCPGAGRPSPPSCYHCGCVVMVLLQAFVLPPPAKHQHHHRDDYC